MTEVEQDELDGEYVKKVAVVVTVWRELIVYLSFCPTFSLRVFVALGSLFGDDWCSN